MRSVMQDGAVLAHADYKWMDVGTNIHLHCEQPRSPALALVFLDQEVELGVLHPHVEPDRSLGQSCRWSQRVCLWSPDVSSIRLLS